MYSRFMYLTGFFLATMKRDSNILCNVICSHTMKTAVYYLHKVLWLSNVHYLVHCGTLQEQRVWTVYESTDWHTRSRKEALHLSSQVQQLGCTVKPCKYMFCDTPWVIAWLCQVHVMVHVKFKFTSGQSLDKAARFYTSINWGIEHHLTGTLCKGKTSVSHNMKMNTYLGS